ncbi:uncharacterized protein LOC111798734 [Cucurbita pepo subsp. pepo]|uniref:uncharacterized protein LOC111798734 n=1 Tax=Cucurbita pepo subsp. pepo TaxID=3664 RepID=UPI000C9D6319|nr:uncharacterized protein LOC111798734 [Cucurbita pepo subsp. pepo]
MKSMKSRTSKSKPTAPPADLLVCFPARSPLTLLPKPICSPARPPSESHRRHQKRPTPVGAAQASPLLWAKELASEPTSPKVTCAGKIKIRPTTKNWRSVMEEIERIHKKKKKKLPNQNQNPLRFKREIVNILSCFRGFRFDFRCFRGFHQSVITSEEEQEDGDGDGECESEEEPNKGSRRTMFAEWFMIVQEKEETKPRNNISCSVPPPNALLLMRCRSVGWIERKPKEEQEDDEKEEKQSKISHNPLLRTRSWKR